MQKVTKKMMVKTVNVKNLIAKKISSKNTVLPKTSYRAKIGKIIIKTLP